MVARREWLAFGAVVLVFVLLRLPLFREPAVRLGWHSDAAAFGLMARDIYEGRPRLFWYGQAYMGVLTSGFGALGGVLVAPFGAAPAVGPLAMRIGTAIQWLLMTLLYWLGMRIAFGPRVAIVTALLLVTGPDWFFHSQLAPRGGEMLLFLSAAVFALSAQGLEKKRHWLLFGALTGIGWWMHQGIIFAAGAALIVAVLRSEAWATARNAGAGRRTLLMREAPMPLRIVNLVLLILIAAAVIREFAPRFPAFFLHHPLAEPLGAWLLFRAVVLLTRDVAVRNALRHLATRRDRWLPHMSLFGAGFLAGYAPVIAGTFAGLEERTYGLSTPLQSFRDVLVQAARVARSDFWLLVGGSWTPLGIATMAVFVALLAAHAVRHRKSIARFLLAHPAAWGPRAIAGATLLLCAAFYTMSSRAYEGAVRYIMPALPMLFAFALAEAEAWWEARRRVVAGAAVAVLTIGFALQSILLVRDIAAARAEGRFFTGAGFNSGPAFDPRPVMAAIERGGYQVCYADYSVAMHLEWLLDRRVRFLSYNSIEPRRALARRLAALPAPKCYVDMQGNVRPWDPREHDRSVADRAAERLQQPITGGAAPPRTPR